MKKIEILDSVWFGTIGIVKIDTGFETKWYIGKGEGISQKDDEEFIASYGTPFYPKMLSLFFMDNISRTELKNS